MEGIPRDVLTRLEAEERARRVANVSYEIELELLRGSQEYRGEARIRFDHAGQGEIFLDFRGRRIERLEVNGARVEPDWRDSRLVIPAVVLRSETSIRVVYENAYDETGDGFHRFVDPEDGEEYRYTNFEPFAAHRVFPAFDQPDIKANYRLAVTAPEEWEVVSNTAEEEREQLGDGLVRRMFRWTPRFSTYLLTLVAGPLHVVHRAHGDLPMALYCRRSVARYLEPDEIFGITSRGIDFYATLFDQPYPFGKYDQLFVPEFNPGAMENAGAVTFNEQYIFRDPPTENQRRERAEVILHELAHMWFGNLTTMRWWDDLWLNESFATFISVLAQSEALGYGDGPWKVFNASMKRWAYRQDQLITTHPIVADVPDTDATFLNFDGITYGKGASVLKQLAATIEPDGFREGMRTYFRRHAWGNATLSDFLSAVEEGSGRPLREWARLWLETASLNTLSAHWAADGDRIHELRLEQRAPREHPTLRPHAIEVALGRETGERLVLEAIPARIDGASVLVSDAFGRPAPDLVFPNHRDQTYAKVQLDAGSLRYVRERLERVEDPLLRQLLWMSLWEMVRDRKLSSIEFLRIAGDKLRLEPDLELLDSVLERVHVVLDAYVPEPLREREGQLAFVAACRNLASAPPGDARIIWTRSAIAVASRRDDVRHLLAMADADADEQESTVDQEMRWSIAAKGIAYGLEGADDRLAAEAERDPSDRGRRSLIVAETSLPTADAKTRAWERIHGEGYGSLKLTGAAMRGFWWPCQADILEPYVGRYFEEVRRVFDRHDATFARTYARAMFPSYRADPGVLERSETLLGELDGSNPVLERILREANDELARTIACRAFALERETEPAG